MVLQWMGTVLLLVIELLFLISFSIWTIFLIYSALKGSPYVRTKKRLVDTILKNAHLTKGMRFLELGCGDGRMLRNAVRRYGVTGLGIDINPLVIQRARWLSRLIDPSRIQFRVKDIRDPLDISEYDVIYIYLLPELIEETSRKIEKEAKPGVLVISHAFEIPKWKKYLEKTIPTQPTDTYYYRLPQE